VKSDNSPSSILIIRLSSLGDILFTSPLIRVLRKRFPQSQLHVLTSARYQKLLSHNPNLDKVITLGSDAGLGQIWSMGKQLRTAKYDTIIDLHGSLRSLIIRFRLHASCVLRFRKFRIQRAILIICKRNLYPDNHGMALWMMDAAKSLGAQDDGDGLDLFVSPEVESKVGERLGSRLGLENLIAFAPGARHATKRWLLGGWRELAQKLISQSNANILILGDAKEKQFGDEIVSAIGNRGWNAAGELSLQESAAALSICRAVITNDSGIMHLGAARRIPVVAIFGPTVQAFGFYPFRVPFRIVERSLPCRPCSTKGPSRCPLGHFRCMRDISTDDVLKAFLDISPP
jgi:heptosyltransferase-2